MARELRLDVNSDASGARRGLDSAADGVDHLRRETNRLEHEFQQASRAAAGLDRQLLETKAATRALAAEFARTKDVGVGAALDQQKAKLRDLSKLQKDILGDTEKNASAARKALKKALQGDSEKRRDKGIFGLFGDPVKVAKAGAETASTFAAAFEGGIMNAFKALPAPAQAGIVAGLLTAVAAAAPAIASAINAAVLLGVGGAGLAAGIALAVRSDRVKAAFAEFGRDALAALEAAADPFRDQLVASAGIFRRAFADSLPDLRGIFSALSTAVQPLARGLSGLIQNALPGLRRAAEAAVPLFNELAKDLPELGDAASDFFSGVAKGAPGAIAVMRELMVTIEDTLRGFGAWLAEYGQVLAGAAAISSAMGLTDTKTHQLSGTLGELPSAFGDVSQSADGASRAVRKFKLELDELFNRQMDAREAAIAYEQALDDLAEGFKRGSGALDINNQKGRDNLKLVDDAIRMAREKLKADLAAGDGTQAAVDKANAAYQAEIEKIREVLRHLGLSEQEINNLIGTAAAIPRDITIDIGLIGANAAAGMLNQLGNAIGRLSGLGGVSASAYKQLIPKRASGGPVMAGKAYIVGENRPEVFVPNTNGQILPSISAMSRYATPSGSSGRSGPPNLIYSGNPTGLESMFLSWLMKKVRTGEVQLA